MKGDGEGPILGNLKRQTGYFLALHDGNCSANALRASIVGNWAEGAIWGISVNTFLGWIIPPGCSSIDMITCEGRRTMRRGVIMSVFMAASLGLALFVSNPAFAETDELLGVCAVDRDGDFLLNLLYTPVAATVNTRCVPG